MAKYHQLVVKGEVVWHLMSPSNPWEAIRIAWMLWRYPDRIAALVGVEKEFSSLWTPSPSKEKTDDSNL